MTVATVARFAGLELVLDAALEDRITDILKRLMARFDNVDIDAVRAANRKQALDSGRRARHQSGRHRSGRRRAGQADDRGAARPAARAAADVAGCRADTDAVQRGDRRPNHVPPGDGADVRAARVGPGRHVARRRTAASTASTGSRSPPACGVASSRSSPATNPTPRASTRNSWSCCASATDGRSSPKTAHSSTTRSRAAGRPPDRDGRILHRRAAGRPADRPARDRRPTSPAESSPTRTRRRPNCSASNPTCIAAHGAVSEPVAEAMADGAMSRFGADTAIAITGIAGPGGGTDDKPVGTVCFTVKLADGETVHPHHPVARRSVRHSRAVDDRRDAHVATRAARQPDDSTASRNARSASSPCTANTTRSRDRGSCPRTASTISRAASSSGKPPTPVPNATRASDRQPSSSALARVERVAWAMICRRRRARRVPSSQRGSRTGRACRRRWSRPRRRGRSAPSRGLALHRRTSGAGDRGGHPAAVPEPCVGRVGDRVDHRAGSRRPAEPPARSSMYRLAPTRAPQEEHR